ncbi:substrate-binding domain-containing protein [Cohnella sp. CFH 77786]|uniref:autoinducer 2 ABC transporter substrate-binding protein n=1 Tax=Cohnella sp. CFH 77786 TaxID=2662265 RepID=UPI001C60E6C3|nr:autoinducer 2 ABC transporter substrate-binding protein [Cohnella sp. CFH 77786]MBW5446864.1 substrate-binding domain-containing protein [Cohnella sp. CFH 77786]
MFRRMVLLLAFFVILCACGNGKSGPYEVVFSMDGPPNSESASITAVPAGKRYTIAIVPKGVEIPYFQYAAEGAREAGAEFGDEVIFEGPRNADAEEQIRIIEDLIDRKVDLLAVSANDPDKLVPVLRKAKQQGIRVITWDADTEPPAREFFVNMVEPETLGRHLMDTMAMSMGESGEFAILTGSLAAANLNEWLRWIRVQHEEFYPNMKLLEVVPTDDDQNKAYEEARRLLAEYPNLKGLLGNSSVGPPGAAKAVREAGKAGRVKVVGLSNPNLMAEYLRDDSAQMATLWSPKKLGYLTVVLAHRYLDGAKPADGQEIDKVGSIRVNGDMVIMGEPLDFTKDNVDQYDF